MTVGIYCLSFSSADNLCYIGQSLNIEDRYKQHCNLLKTNKHHNYKLQLYYNDLLIYPELNTLEVVSDYKNLDNKEIYWISEFDSFKNGFNLTLGGKSSRGSNHPSALYDHETYINIFKELVNTDKTYKEIADEYNISISIVSNIASSNKHLYLQTLYPELYNKLLDKRGNRKIGRQDGSSYPIIVCPNKIQYIITNVSKFTKEHKLHQGHITDVLNGKKNQYKGWKLWKP